MKAGMKDPEAQKGRGSTPIPKSIPIRRSLPMRSRLPRSGGGVWRRLHRGGPRESGEHQRAGGPGDGARACREPRHPALARPPTPSAPLLGREAEALHALFV